MAARKLTMQKAIVEALDQAMERDPRIFYMGEDVGVYGGIFGATQGLYQKYGEERIKDTPISETAFIGAAIGAAAEGMRPIVELMFVDFFGVCFDQIFNHMAKNTYMSGGSVRLPIVLMTAFGAGYNDAAQHSQSLYAIFGHVPGLKVVVPSTAYDAKGLLLKAIQDDNPVVYLFHKGLMGLGWMPSPPTAATEVPQEPYTIPFGQADIKREGTDVTIVTLGWMVHRSLEAAEKLQQEGISVEVLDLRTLVPLDREAIIRSVAKTGRLVVVDEDYRSYGLSGEVVATVVEHDPCLLKAPVQRVAVPDVPIPYSRPLENFVIPNPDRIAEAVRRTLA
ncbi:alpha-ketoacid dehydrogenase subunit beta [Thermus scotoductus]|uniref:Alpha-ketoacid dehydrogenase subunit beta n=1 Tax=Thermus scotoductus TaxID=37636 RepID=A0A430UTA2_THESC|nr:alpha-ketoacid dehydrogenase subunit beta [Thermus scotoductus]RTI11806.1 alpha-ketoacid dehydrogenase subunit beta [Thermus scotoductus]